MTVYFEEEGALTLPVNAKEIAEEVVEGALAIGPWVDRKARGHDPLHSGHGVRRHADQVPPAMDGRSVVVGQFEPDVVEHRVTRNRLRRRHRRLLLEAEQFVEGIGLALHAGDFRHRGHPPRAVRQPLDIDDHMDRIGHETPHRTHVVLLSGEAQQHFDA